MRPVSINVLIRAMCELKVERNMVFESVSIFERVLCKSFLTSSSDGVSIS